MVMEEKDRALKNVETSTMVECPFCKQGIEAPDKPGVIFECPNCHKELITYDKRREQPRLEREKELEKQLKAERLKFLITIGVLAAVVFFLIFYMKKNEESPVDKNELVAILQNTQTKKVVNDSNTGEGQRIGSWSGKTWDNHSCSYTLVKEGDNYKLIENSTSKVYDCTHYVLRSPTEYYFVDPDMADINKNLACFNLEKGTSIYIIHGFDYDAVHDKQMNGILVIFAEQNVRIYLDMLINGTAYYLNNGNPPISRVNSQGELEYYNADGTNEPAYECYAVLH